MNLASKYRPSSFDDFVGSETTVTMLQNLLATKSLPPCLILTGKHGTGKTTAARLISAAINNGDDSSTYLEIDAASNSGVDNIRELVDNVRYIHSGTWRVVCLDEAHMLSRAAFNALLKTLEDPPAKTSFILATTKPEAIPDTIQSRAMMFRIAPISEKAIARRLIEVITAESLPITDPQTVLRLASVAEGSMRNALVLLEQVLLTEDRSPSMVDYLAGKTVTTKDLLYSMLSGDIRKVEEELSQLQSTNCDYSRLVETLASDLRSFFDARVLTSAQYLKAVEVVWSLRKIFRLPEGSMRMVFEAGIFALFSQCFWDGTDGSSDESVAATIGDLQSLNR